MNEAKLQALVDGQIGRSNIKNVVLSIQSDDEHINFARAAGQAGAGQPMTPETPYYLASITKMYTAAVILNLADQGRLDLNAPFASYLPDSHLDGIHVYKGHDYSRTITIAQLATQTSGLADYFLDKPRGGRAFFDELKQGHDIALDEQRVLSIVRTLEPAFEPDARQGTRAHYADTNYRLLGSVIEAVTGRTVAQQFDEMIFAPLELAHTYVYDAGPRAAQHPPAAVYLQDRALVLPQFFATNPTEGGIVATVGDSLTFLRGFFAGKLFDASHLDQILQHWNGIFFPMQYGFGLMRVNMPRIFSPFKPFPKLIGHSGSTGSFAYYNPAKGLYIAGTVNQIDAPRRPIQMMLQAIDLVS